MLIGIDAHNLEGNRTGVGRYLFNLMRIWSQIGLSKYFHTSKYGSICSAGMKFIFYFKDEISSDLPGSELFEYSLLKASSTAKFIHWDLARAAQRDRVDVLFCPGYVAPLGYQGKIALTLHDIIYEAHPEWYNRPSIADRILLRWVSKKSAQKAAVIFVPSDFSKREVIKYYRVPPEKVCVTPLAAGLGGLPDIDEEKTGQIKAEFGINNQFIFYVGSIFSRRHLPEVIAAFRRLAGKSPAYQLLVGGTDYTPAQSVKKIIQKTNQELGCQEAIVQIDHIDDSELKLLYSACAFFIWLSDYEGFGLPPLEAMSCGAPVITSDSSSLKEVVGEAALLIKNNSDVEEIYQAMKRMIGDNVLRQELIKKEKEQTRKFSWEKCAEETLKTLINT